VVAASGLDNVNATELTIIKLTDSLTGVTLSYYEHQWSVKPEHGSSI
jgi:hypothetical protein